MEMLRNVVAVVNALVVFIGAILAVWKWVKRREHFPRIALDVQARFIEVSARDTLVLEVVATIENKGLVPIKIEDFEFSLRVLRSSDKWVLADEGRRRQLDFGDRLLRAKFVTEKMEYTFVFPGIRTEYTYVTVLDPDVELIRINADFRYPRSVETHHAARVFAVPKRATASLPVTTNGTVAASGAAPA